MSLSTRLDKLEAAMRGRDGGEPASRGLNMAPTNLLSPRVGDRGRSYLPNKN